MNNVEANTHVVYVHAVIQHTMCSIVHWLYMNSCEVCTKARSNEKHKNVSVVCCINKKYTMHGGYLCPWLAYYAHMTSLFNTAVCS